MFPAIGCKRNHNSLPDEREDELTKYIDHGARTYFCLSIIEVCNLPITMQWKLQFFITRIGMPQVWYPLIG